MNERSMQTNGYCLIPSGLYGKHTQLEVQVEHQIIYVPEDVLFYKEKSQGGKM